MRKAFAAVLMMSAVALGGCTLFEPAQEGPLVPGTTSTIQDVPVPSGFKYSSDGSWSKVQPELKLREAVQNYYGKAPLLRIAAFYQEELPKTGWSNVELQQQPERVVLKATKRGEVLVVTSWNQNMYTYINVRLEPAGKRVN